jgi:LysR family pca operon transcriptional activator
MALMQCKARVGRIKQRHLVCLLEVAKTGSMTKAAEILHVSQPAVSKTIRELEEIVDVKLTMRDGTRVILTKQGRMFCDYAEASVTALRDGYQAISDSEVSRRIDVAIGALPSVASYIMPPTVRKLTQAMDVRVRVITGPNYHLLEQLRLGDIDIVVGFLPDVDTITDLLFEHLYAESIIFVVRPGHPLLNGYRAEMATWGQFPFILPAAASSIRNAVERMLISAGIEMKVSPIESSSTSFSRHYVATSDAIWVVSRGTVHSDTAAGQLIDLATHEQVISEPIGMITRASSPPSLVAKKFMSLMRQEGASLKRQQARPAADRSIITI